jgi:hypothetical protein
VSNIVAHDGKIIKESVWQATINYINGTTETILIKDPWYYHNLHGINPKDKERLIERTRYRHLKTKTGLLQAGIFTIKDAHYFAFGQSGFGVKNIQLRVVQIEYRVKDKSVRVL